MPLTTKSLRLHTVTSVYSVSCEQVTKSGPCSRRGGGYWAPPPEERGIRICGFFFLESPIPG